MYVESSQSLLVRSTISIRGPLVEEGLVSNSPAAVPSLVKLLSALGALFFGSLGLDCSISVGMDNSMKERLG